MGEIKLKKLIFSNKRSKNKNIKESAFALDTKTAVIAQMQLNRLEKFKQDIYGVFSDKELMNFLDKAEDRIRELIQNVKGKSGGIK